MTLPSKQPSFCVATLLIWGVFSGLLHGAQAQCGPWAWDGSHGTVVSQHTGYNGPWWMGGGAHDYTINVPSGCAGQVRLRVDYARGAGGSGTQVATIQPSGTQQRYSLAGTGGWFSQRSVTVNGPPFRVVSGRNILRIQCDDGANTRRFTLTMTQRAPSAPPTAVPTSASPTVTTTTIPATATTHTQYGSLNRSMNYVMSTLEYQSTTIAALQRQLSSQASHQSRAIDNAISTATALVSRSESNLSQQINDVYRQTFIVNRTLVDSVTAIRTGLSQAITRMPSLAAPQGETCATGSCDPEVQAISTGGINIRAPEGDVQVITSSCSVSPCELRNAVKTIADALSGLRTV